MPKRQSKKQKRPNKKGSQNTNTLRIIAGQWRGRKLSFATAPSLRPTPDRVRETLFNWLQGHLHDARCLDLFAGSGALAFEALSRGAAHVTLIESNPEAVEKLRENIQLLQTENALLIPIDAFQYLDTQCLDGKPQKPIKPRPQAFDLIFLDPPFRQNYLPKLLTIIHDKDLLTKSGVIYLEYENAANPQLEELLKPFNVLKEKKAGQVVSLLISLG